MIFLLDEILYMRKMFAVNGLCEMVKLSETSIDIIHRSLMPIYGIYKRGINVNDVLAF